MQAFSQKPALLPSVFYAEPFMARNFSLPGGVSVFVMRNLLALVLVFVAVLTFCAALGADTYALLGDRATEIDELMSTLYERGQFNGAILVAEQGEIIYGKGFGKANFQTGTDFTADTPSNIGSVTKQFTGVALMILGERKKLNYDDPISKYIPEFSRSAHLSRITLRHLLTHTSGIPDYGDLGIDDSGLGQQGLIEGLLKKENIL